MYPEQQPSAEEPRSGFGITPAVRGFLVVIVFALVALVIYGIHERNTANALAQQTSQMSAALNDTKSQIDSLSSKLSTMVAAQQQEAQQHAQAAVAQRQVARRVIVHRSRAEEARYKKLQEQIEAQGKQIDQTRTDLTSALDSTKTELNGSIARTHDEIVVLQRKGERNYFEFDVDKSKQYQRAGSVSLSLRKANTKHDYADLELMVDDAHVSQKHVNLYQPVMFYAGESDKPVELVINKIGKNHIHGYISEPKYRQADLAAMSAQAQQAQQQPQNVTANAQSAAPASAPTARRKLQLPQ